MSSACLPAPPSPATWSPWTAAFVAASPIKLLTALKFSRGSGSAPPPALLPAPRASAAAGKHILGPAFNLPVDDEYLSMMRQPHFYHDSRLINSALALGSQCTAPSSLMRRDGAACCAGGKQQ